MYEYLVDVVSSSNFVVRPHAIHASNQLLIRNNFVYVIFSIKMKYVYIKVREKGGAYTTMTYKPTGVKENTKNVT